MSNASCAASRAESCNPFPLWLTGSSSFTASASVEPLAVATTATGSTGGAAALVGEVPNGFFFNTAAGDALVIGSLALSFNGDGDAAAFSGDALRCVAVAVLAESSDRRTVLLALVGAECVNLGAGRAVKVFVMVVVVVVVVWLPDPLLAVADLTRMLLLVVDELAVLATPLASGLLGLRVPATGPAVAVAGLRIVDPNVLRGEGTFGLAAVLLPAVPVDVVVVDLLALTCRRGFTCATPVVPAAVPLLLVVVAVLRVVEVVVVVRAAIGAVLDLLAATLLATGAVAGRVPAVLLPVAVLGVGLAELLLEASGLRAAALVVLAAPVAVVVDVVEAVVLAAGAVRGRAAAAAAAVPAGLAAAVLPTVVFLIGPPAAAAAAVGLALAADVAVVDAVLAMGFFAASPGEVLILGLDVATATAAAAATAVAAVAAIATSATGAFSSSSSSTLGGSSATISAASLGFSCETASVICSFSFSAIGSATIGSTIAIAGSISVRAGSRVSLLARPFV